MLLGLTMCLGSVFELMVCGFGCLAGFGVCGLSVSVGVSVSGFCSGFVG